MIRLITTTVICSLLLSSCTTTSIVDGNWLNNNCPSFTPFVADNCESLANCATYSDTICMCAIENNEWYTGEFKSGERHGFGKYEWSNGSSYMGYWSNGKKACGIENNSNSDYFVFRDGEIVDSGNNISDGLAVGLTVIIIAGVAYAISESGGSGSSNGFKNSRTDTDWDWDWQPGSNSWACRGINTGQYAELVKCRFDAKDDDRWP